MRSVPGPVADGGVVARRRRGVLEREDGLEHRRAAEIARDAQLLDQLLERDVLVAERGDADVADPDHQLAERGRAAEVDAQRQRVREVPDQVEGLRVVAVCDRRADDDLVLAGEALQQRGVAGQQHHEQRRAVASADRGELLDQRAGQVEGRGVAGGRRQLAARAHRRQRQHRQRRSQGLLPGGDPARPGWIVGAGDLPHRVVGVLDVQRGQRRGRALDAGLVTGGEVALEHVLRPAVGHDVVHREQQHVVGVAQLDQHAAEQRPGGEIERAAGVLGQGRATAPRARLGVGLGAQVDADQIDRARRRDPLHRAVGAERQGGAQGGVARRDVVERAAQRRDVERVRDQHATGTLYVARPGSSWSR